MSERIGPQGVLADVLTAMVAKPGQWSKKALAQDLSKQYSEVQRSVNHFRSVGWLRQSTEGSVQNQTFEPTRVFWSDFAFMNEGLTILENEQVLYDQAVEERQKMAKTDPESLEHVIARANFIGRTVVLGETYDLSRDADWFAAEHGWRSLISIQVLAPASLAEQAQ